MKSETALQRLSTQTQTFVEQTCAELSRKLPPHLRILARQVATSPKGWEWKQFWMENAKLWLQQHLATKKLKPTQELWGKTEDVVFEGWNRSEYAQAFMNRMGKSQDLKAASSHCLGLLEHQLIAFAKKHFGIKNKRPVTYKPQFELGDFPQASVSLWLGLDEQHSLELLSWDRKNAATQLHRIERALSLIKTYSPASYVRFKHFTRRIVPIKQKEMVSYSLQTLPGHSFINLYHRDEIDLLDDLLHENGHHQLNLHLIQKNLLREDPDQIYYSPWRRTLRPVRGIYHAHCTFFYALALFHDLAQAMLTGQLDWPSTLSTPQKQKILYRFCEEWMMLDFTAVDLARAKRRGQVTAEGWKVFKEIERQRMVLKPLLREARKLLDRDHAEALQNLGLILETQAKLTRAGR